MQKLFKNIFILGVLSVLFAACKKDDSNFVTYKGGNDITLSVVTNASSSTVDLSNANANKKAIDISWSNPEYLFSDGISSQDVTYLLEIDTVGASFTNPDKKVISISKDLKLNLDQKTFNGYIAFEPTEGLGLAVNQPHNIEMRIIATLRGVAATKYVSNVIQLTVTPYLDPSKKPIDLYITGNATPSDWTNNPPESQKFTSLPGKKYEITMNFVPGKYYKFLTTLGKWQPQYGSSSATGGPLGLNDGSGSDPDAIPTPAEAGTYKIEVDLRAQTFTVTKL